MKIKKYEARTEQEAIEKVKQELGLEALILNIKKTQPKGLFAFLRKPSVEVTAAFDENKARPYTQPETEKHKKSGKGFFETGGYFENRIAAQKKPPVEEETVFESGNLLESAALKEQSAIIRNLEKKLTDTEDMLGKAVAQLSITSHKLMSGARKFENNLVQVFYDALVEQGVTPEIAEKILEEISVVEDGIDLPTIVKVVYNKIVGILGSARAVSTQKSPKGKPRIMVFIGSTGVGKTTTIAKLSSQYILRHSLRVGFITADTYRIAAVEQLKTYAEILDAPIGVVYNNDDLIKNVASLENANDIIMIDTAGRSHKNQANLDELKLLLSAIPQSQQFLLLSISTKVEDLLGIIEAYSQFTDFDIIFTKLDETVCLGTILNICYLTGKKISYVTTGQNVPDDIEEMQPEKIAKALMGLGGMTA